jgi:hypothetical protein
VAGWVRFLFGDVMLVCAPCFGCSMYSSTLACCQILVELADSQCGGLYS